MAVIHPNLNQKVRGLRCWYCGNQAYNLDHRIPQSRMRGVGPGNKVPACLTCNSVKGSFTVDEFREYLKQHAKSYKSRCRPRLGMIIRTIEPHGFIFFGERHWAKASTRH